MYAVVETGGKQYRVAIGDKLKVEKLDVEEGTTIELDRVLMTSNDGEVTVGSPLVDGTAVGATVLGQGRGEKIKVYKFKRRKKYRRTQGHRQSYTELEITSIGAATGEAKAAPKKVEAKKVAPKKAAPKKESVAEVAVAATAAAAVAAPLFSKPEGDVDDLKKISGVGPVLEGKLNDLGIYTFAQVAAFTKEDIVRVDDRLSFKGRIDRDNWLSQAKTLAEES